MGFLGYEVRCRDCCFRSSGAHKYDEPQTYGAARDHERRNPGHSADVVKHFKVAGKPRSESIVRRFIWETSGR